MTIGNLAVCKLREAGKYFFWENLNMNQGTLHPFSLAFNSLLRCPRCRDENIVIVGGEGVQGVECNKCKTKFPIIDGIPVILTTKHEEKQIKEDWFSHDKAAEHYNRIPLHHFWDAEGSPIAKYMNQGILTEKKETVEVGSGTGTIAKHMLDKGSIKTKCIDIALRSVKHVKKLNLPVILATNFNLPLKNNVFDNVISYGVIHHTPNPALCMKELSRILKSGGHLILVLFRKWSFYHLWFLVYAPIPRILRKILGRKLGDLFIYPYYLILFYIPFWLGLIFYQKRIGPPRLKDVWSTFNDQFLSPHESYHTIKDVKQWANDNNLTIEDHFNFCRPGGGALGVLLRKI